MLRTAEHPMIVTITDTRIVAKDVEGREICGAFARGDGWQMYVTAHVATLTGLTTPPHREHFTGANGKHTVTQWVRVIAKLYSLAIERESP